MSSPGLGALFPNGVAWSERRLPESSPPPLRPEEAGAVAGAVAVRRAEFAAGRACARSALGSLGEPIAAIPMGPDRAPIWPQGLVGSISHTRRWCGAVVSRAADVPGLGLDAEPALAVEVGLLPTILGDQELAWAAATSAPMERVGTLMFCAKEAAYKAQYPSTGHVLGFHDVVLEVRLDEGAFCAARTGGPVFARGRFRWWSELVQVGAWLSGSRWEHW